MLLRQTIVLITIVYIIELFRYPNIKDIEKRGMQVLTYYIPEDVMSLCTESSYEFIYKISFNSTPEESMNTQLVVFPGIVHRDCHLMMSDKEFMQTVSSIKFDIALVEYFLLGPCTTILPHVLKIPFITLSPLYPPWFIRVPAFPSVLILQGPWLIHNLKTFGNRLLNFITFFLYEYSGAVKHDMRLLQKYAQQFSTWEELLRESKLFLFENHHVLMPSYPTMPNVVMVGGLTATPHDYLSPEIEAIAAANGNGFILMSFGSIISPMPIEIVEKFMQGFSLTNKTVLVTIPVMNHANVPDNVKLFHWLPQNDLLGHGNIKLFITHCGNNGRYEAVYHGVPMLGFPLFADQHINCAQLEQRNYGLCMNIYDFSAEMLRDNIQKLTDSSTIRSSVLQASKMMKFDINAREKAARWIEHIIEFGGEHLRSDAMGMPLHEFLMIDVIAALLVALLATVSLMLLILHVVVRKAIRYRNNVPAILQHSAKLKEH